MPSLLVALAPVGRFLRSALAMRVRLPVWMLAVALAFGWHWHASTLAKAEKRAAERVWAEVAVRAQQLKERADRLSSAVTEAIRRKNDETSGRIAARADDQRLRGPGKARASCPAVPAPAGERPEAGRDSDAAGPGLPAEDRATVPWEWLVRRAATCDLNRAEVLAWREWHQRVLEAWPK